METLKKSILKCFWIYLALYFGLFLLFYIPNYVIEDYAYLVGDFEYVRFFLARLYEFTLGASAAVVLFVILVRNGEVTVPVTLAAASVFALAKIIYSLPYYYLYFLSIGYDSIDGIPLYTLSALLAVIFEWVKTILFFSVCYLVSRRHIKKELISRLPVAKQKKPPEKERAEIKRATDMRLSDELTLGGTFNFDAPVTLGIFLVSVGQFAFALISEITSTVDYLIEFAGNYRTDEIVYMTFCFIFILAELVISHLVCHYIKNYTARKLTYNTEN